MSDLHCPARLFIARHGDASYPHGPGLLTSAGGRLTNKGLDQVRALAASLLGKNIAAVYSSRVSRAQESAHVAAEVLRAPQYDLGGLQEYEVGDLEGVTYGDERAQNVFDAWMDGDLAAGFPGGESGKHIIERYREALLTIADLYRGENVLVFSHGGVMALAIPRLSCNVRNDLARKQYLPNAVAAQVLVDADGFKVEGWPGTQDKRSV